VTTNGAKHHLGPLAFGLGLYGLNNLGTVSGWWAPPPGYLPMFVTRQTDVAQYLTWIEAYRSQGPLLPDYHAPWQTEPALFSPAMWLLSKASGLLGIDGLTSYRLVHLLTYVIAAYALAFAIRTFTASRRERWLAFVLMLCVVPLRTLRIIPAILLNGDWDPVAALEKYRPWRGLIVGGTVDGFFHAIPGSMLATFGTGMTILAFALLATYFNTGLRRHLALFMTAVFVGALLHPFEAFVIAGGASIALALREPERWRDALWEVGAVAISCAVGLAPHVYLVARHRWLRDVAASTDWYPGQFITVMAHLGLPAILALTFLVLQPRMRAKTDLLLQSWFVCTLVGSYIPGLPWSQHLFDGFHYCTGLLLARQLAGSRLVGKIASSAPRFTVAALGGWCILALVPHAGARWQAFRDGNQAQPRFIPTTVAPSDEISAIHWLRQHASPGALILAPELYAPWMATVPMHSFGSHWMFSITGKAQNSLANAFFDGRLDPQQATELLDGYGVRYVLVPNHSRATRYLRASDERATLGALTLYEFPAHSMSAYPATCNGAREPVS